MSEKKTIYNTTVDHSKRFECACGNVYIGFDKETMEDCTTCSFLEKQKENKEATLRLEKKINFRAAKCCGNCLYYRDTNDDYYECDFDTASLHLNVWEANICDRFEEGTP